MNKALPENPEKPLVVLIHGLAAGPLSMSVLGRRLRAQGFRVEYWSYPSLFQPIKRHAARLREHLTGSLSHEPKIHIVAHSMGPILARAAVAGEPIPNLGRMVFLAPPNRGLPIARLAEKIVGRIFRPFVDLSSRPDSYVNSLPPLPDVEVGVIAAKYDLLIPVRRTHLDGESLDADPSLQGCAALNTRSAVHGDVGIKYFHNVIPATHISILISRRAANLCASFLNDVF